MSKTVFLVLATLLIAGCSTSEFDRSPGSVLDENLFVYRVPLGKKADPKPIFTTDITKAEFHEFKKTLIFKDRTFRRENFYNGCYQFVMRSARMPANVEQDERYCYRSRDDKMVRFKDLFN